MRLFRSNRAVERRAAEWYSTGDFRTIKKLLSAWKTAATVAPEDWPVWTRDRLAARPNFERRISAEAATLGKALGSAQPPRPLRDLALDQMALSEEIPLQIMRNYVPGGWKPRAEIEGAEHLQRAKNSGRGAVLWIAEFLLRTPFAYAALAQQADVRLSHLSGPRHGFSGTRFGMLVLNPIRTSAELRFLRERIVMSDLKLPTETRVLAAMRQLRSRVAEGCIVSVTGLVSDWGPVRAQFLDGTVRLAYGAPGIAYQEDVPLHPVYALRRDGRDVLVIDDPIDMRKDLPRRKAAIAATHDYAARLEQQVRQYPEQWYGWRYYEPDEKPGS